MVTASPAGTSLAACMMMYGSCWLILLLLLLLASLSPPLALLPWVKRSGEAVEHTAKNTVFGVQE